jgi:tetratricopeptide (TPR) repeat protein
VLCGEGRERAALEHAKVAVVAEEGNADRHYMLGCIHRTLGNHLEAAQSFARAVKLRPTFLEAYINNDAVLLKLGSLKGCYKYAEMAVRETRAHGVPFWTNPLQRPPAFVPVRRHPLLLRHVRRHRGCPSQLFRVAVYSPSRRAGGLLLA